MLYDLLLWDLDGTLTDPKQGITKSVQYALENMGYEVPSNDELEWVIGPPLSSSFRELLKTNDEELVRKAIILYRERYAKLGMFENIVYPGIPDLLADLKRNGCHHILATSKARIFAEQILVHFQLDKFFDLAMGSELNGQFAEKDEVIKEGLRRYGVYEPLKTAMIGDRRFDVHGAHKNGINIIAVSYGYGTMSELETAKPEFIVDSVDSLRELLYKGK